MAHKVITQLVDDLDGTDLKGQGETVRFSLDSKSYEIDLSNKNAKGLRDALAQYVAAARRTGHSGGRSRRSSSGRSNDAAEVRAWAKAQGIDVPARGRIPASIRAAYEGR